MQKRSTSCAAALGALALLAPTISMAENAFSGFYGGVAISSGFNGDSIITAPDGGSIYDWDIKGSNIALLGGYNFQSGRLVAGIEADANFGKLKDSRVVTQFGVTYSGNAELGTYYTVRGRLGFTPSDNLLLFGTAGPAWGKLSTSTILTGAPLGPFSPFTSVKAEKDVTGYVLGVGGEYQFTESLGMRLEYSELYFNKVDFTQRIPGGPTDTFRTDNSAAFVRTGVQFKF